MSLENSADYSYDDFLRIPSLPNRLVGYYLEGSPLSQRTKLFLDIYRWICNFGHYVCVFALVYTFVGDSKDDLKVLMKYACVITYWINSDLKFFTTLQHHSIKRLNAKLEALYPKTIEERMVYHVNEFYWPRSLIFLTRTFFATTVTVVFEPLLTSVLKFFLSPGSEFLYRHYYPFFHFDPQHHTVWRYIAIYFLEFLHASHVAVYQMATDLWLVGFQMQICMQLSYLNRALLRFEPHRHHDYADRKLLTNLVFKHNILFDLQKDLNQIFGGSLLFTLLTTASFICNIAVYIQVGGFDTEGIILIAFTVITILQLYLICHYGQMVNTLSTNIANAAYSNNWFDASLSCKKSLQLIVIRAQRPVELSALGYVPLSLETFKELMSLTYRFFALIRQLIE